MKLKVYKVGNSTSYHEFGMSVFHWGTARMFGADIHLLFFTLRINVTY